MLLFIRFTRSLVDDLEVAQLKFPHLNFDRTLQLLEQFKLELYSNTKLQGLWTIMVNEQIDNSFYLWLFFQWPDSMESFVKELQRTYNEYGMAGEFKIVDAIDANGPSFPLSQADDASYGSMSRILEMLELTRLGR